MSVWGKIIEILLGLKPKPKPQPPINVFVTIRDTRTGQPIIPTEPWAADLYQGEARVAQGRLENPSELPGRILWTTTARGVVTARYTIPGYDAFDELMHIPQLHGEGDVNLMPSKPPRMFPPEVGPLVWDELDPRKLWRTVMGAPLDYRGASMFLLAHRVADGQDITPQIDWMLATGVNIPRIFPAGVGWATQYVPNVEPWLFQRPDYPQIIRRTLDILGEAGLTPELSIITDDVFDAVTWGAIINRTAIAARAYVDAGGPAPLIEDCNEPWVGRKQEILNTLHAMGTVNLQGLCGAYGIMPEVGPDGETFLPCPVRQYITWHSPRPPDSHYSHNGKDSFGVGNAVNRYTVDDESCGIDDVITRPGRTNNLDEILSHMFTARLFGGYTIHTQVGLEGRAPNPDTHPITAEACRRIGGIWNFIPARAQFAAYSRPPWPSFPIVYRDHDSLVNHAYAKIDGDEAWAGVCMPRAGLVASNPNTAAGEWTIEAAPGWQIVDRGPEPFLVHLRRS